MFCGFSLKKLHIVFLVFQKILHVESRGGDFRGLLLRTVIWKLEKVVGGVFLVFFLSGSHSYAQLLEAS